MCHPTDRFNSMHIKILLAAFICRPALLCPPHFTLCLSHEMLLHPRHRRSAASPGHCRRGRRRRGGQGRRRAGNQSCPRHPLDLMVLLTYSSDHPIDLNRLTVLDLEFSRGHLAVYAIIYVGASSSILCLHPYLHCSPIVEDDIKVTCER